MKLGRLGSVEPENDIGMQFLGWGFANLNLGQTEGGGVQSLQQELEAQGASAEEQRREFIRSELTEDDEDAASGAANVPYDFYARQIHKDFLQMHPGLKRFLKSKYPKQKPLFYAQPLSGFGVISPPTDAEIQAAQQEVDRLGAELAAAQTEAYSTFCYQTINGNQVPLPKVHCEPQLATIVSNAVKSLATASDRLAELHKRKEEAASTPAEAAAARQDAQSVKLAQGDLKTAQSDLQAATIALSQAAASGNPTQIALAAKNLNTASSRTGEAAKSVELATSAAKQKQYIKYGAIAGAGLLLLAAIYFYMK